MSNDLGMDRSGNGNNWTVNNITNADQVVDSPTNNFATLNPLLTHTQTLSEGNLKVSNSTLIPSLSTIGASTGKWYAEVHFVSGTHCRIGIANESGVNQNFGHGTGSGNSWIKINGSGFYHDSAHISSQGQSISAGDIVMMAVDVDAGKMWWGKNGVWDDNASGTGVPASGTNPTYTDTGISNGGKIFFGVSSGSGALVFTTNFGQDSSFAGNKTAQGNQDGNGIGDFYYTPPTGFLALCTKNLPDVAVVPSEHFNTVLYTGTGNAQSVNNVGFQPDWVWLKRRSGVQNNNVFDAVRGNTKLLATNTTDVEGTVSQWLNSFDSDGFTVGTAGNVSANGETNVAWNWKANGSGSSNTDGSITSTVSANVDAGFSIVGYTGNGSSSATIGHGLSKAPEMVIVKSRDLASTNWLTAINVTGSYIDLNLNDTSANSNAGDGDYFAQAFTSTTFKPNVNGSNPTNGNGNTYISYCFHSVDGYSKVGSYTGNGNADGTFLYTGHRVAWFMVKNASSTGNWRIYDNKRKTFNANNQIVYANGTDNDQTTLHPVDFLSNGVKIRGTHLDVNTNGATYIYIAFAETPFKYSNAR